MDLMPKLRRTAAVLPLLAALFASPVQADQFKQTADGGTIECSVSARELTRFALVGDQFASVSKLSTGYPYNDFAVTSMLLSQDNQTMVPKIASFLGSIQEQGNIMYAVAAVVSATVPLFILVLFFQRQIVSGLTAGAVKG